MILRVFSRMFHRPFLGQMVNPSLTMVTKLKVQPFNSIVCKKSTLSRHCRGTQRCGLPSIGDIVMGSLGLCVSLAFCEDSNASSPPFKLPDATPLSSRKMIEQSATATVCSAVQLLQITTAAVIDANIQYRTAMSDVLLLLDRSLELLNNDYMQKELAMLMLVARDRMNQAKKDREELLSFLDYVERLANLSAETSFLAGAEFISFSLSDILRNALRQVTEQNEQTSKLEEEVLILQQQLILKSGKKQEQQDEKRKKEKQEEEEDQDNDNITVEDNNHT